MYNGTTENVGNEEGGSNQWSGTIPEEPDEVEKLEPITPENKGEKVTDTNKKYTDENGKKAVIPVGFSVVKNITGDINNIDRGLVISDKPNDDLDNTAGGNQFV